MQRTQHDHLLKNTIRRALAIVRKERAERIEPGHLLLAAYKEDRSDVPTILQAFGVGPNLLRAAIRGAAPDQKSPSATDWPYSPQATAALVAAEKEAQRTGHDQIGPEHLLLGILDTDCPTRDVLLRMEVDPSAARSAVFAQSEMEGRTDIRAICFARSQLSRAG